MTGKRVGYIRVSTEDQNPDRQLEGVQIDKKFIDKASARTTDRPQLMAMLDFVREDDIVIVHSMDRLARNLQHLRKIVDDLVARKVQVHFIKENLIFSGSDSAMANLLLSMMGAFAEFELAFIKERQKEGIEAAKKKGKFKGAKRKLTSSHLQIVIDNMDRKKSKSQLCRELGVSRPTFLKYEKELKQQLVS